MWEIVEFKPEQCQAFKTELNQIQAIIDRAYWSEKFVFEHSVHAGIIGFTPGVFTVLAESIPFLNDYHPVALRDVPDLKIWNFLYGDESYFRLLQKYESF